MNLIAHYLLSTELIMLLGAALIISAIVLVPDKLGTALLCTFSIPASCTAAAIMISLIAILSGIIKRKGKKIGHNTDCR